MRQPRSGKALTGREPDCCIRPCHMCTTAHVDDPAAAKSHAEKCGTAGSHCSAQLNRDHKK